MDANATWGTVNADGNMILRGSGGWSSFRKSTGVYVIRMPGSTATNVAVVASGYRLAFDTDVSQDNAYSTRVLDEETFEVYSYDTGQSDTGSPQDAAFSFIAMGSSSDQPSEPE